MDRLLLADTPSLYFRAFHGVPRSVRAPDGMAVNAVRGLLDVLARQIVEVRPRRLVCCFDADWRPAFRVALIGSYKAHRVADATPGPAVGAGGVEEEVPDELAAQLPVIDAVLDAFGIARVEAAGFEADDVIGTLATRHSGRPGGGPVDILTGDRDLFQLVCDDTGVVVRYAVERFAVVDEASISARYGIPGRAYADFAVLRGDPSDGLPGVAGIGAKTAAALLGRFGSLRAILTALDTGGEDGFPAGARRRLTAARDYVDAAVTVVGVVRDVPLGPVADVLPVRPVDEAALAALAGRYGLGGSVDRLTMALATLAEGP
ncbi:5'-3' exonuclease [Parafrankia sp. FMc6]|uniref:5'-3' exonuclease n=1 Tax=Parafrankia soli TaxID=2599596 RepID=UPI0034D74C2D